MKRHAFLTTTAASTAAFAGCGSGAGSINTTPAIVSSGGPGNVLAGMTIVNTRDGTLAKNMMVVIQGGKITYIAPQATANPTQFGTVLATGGYLVPGYNDMHSHVLIWPDVPAGLNTMLAYGITGFKQLSGTAAMLAARKQSPLTQAPQPALLQMPGDILTPVNATSAAAAVTLVDQQVAAGADFIKSVGIGGPTFSAAIAEAKARGIQLTGHLASTVDPRVAIASGMTGIEHLGPQDALLLGCSTQEQAIRAAITPLPPGGPFATDPNFATDQLYLPSLFYNPVTIARSQQAINTFSTSRMQDLAAQLVANGTVIVPTLTRLRTAYIPTDPVYLNDPNLQYVPSGLLANWKQLEQWFTQYVSPTNQATLSQLYTATAALVRPFKSAGVTLLAGSDAVGEWCIPGPSLHQEFDQLAAAALTPLEILQMTTLNVAQYLGTTSTMGTVDVGKNADLVILSADPTQSAANLHSITGVVRAGQYFNSAALNSLKSAAIKRIAEVPYEVGRKFRCPCCTAYA